MNMLPGREAVAPRPRVARRLASSALIASRGPLPRLALSLLGLLAAGTALADSSRATPPLRLDAATFSAELRSCQTAVGGRLEHRRRLDATHPRIAACLRRRGWNADGTPSLDRLLAPG